MDNIKPGQRVTGDLRSRIGRDLKQKYDNGTPLRELAKASGRSYGFVHKVLAEQGVEFRSRGGVAGRSGKPKL